MSYIIRTAQTGPEWTDWYSNQAPLRCTKCDNSPSMASMLTSYKLSARQLTNGNTGQIRLLLIELGKKFDFNCTEKGY